MKYMLILALGVGLLSSESAAEPAVDDKLRDAFGRAKTERVAVIALGDSNQRFGGHGFTEAMTYALGEAFGSYGSDITAYRTWQEQDGPKVATAPEALVKQTFGGWFVAHGASEEPSWKTGQLIIPADHPLDVSGDLRFHLSYGTFDGIEFGDNIFRPAVRREEPPWDVIASAGEAIDPNTGSLGMSRFVLELLADSNRSWAVHFMPVPIKTLIEGPFYASLATCENTDNQNGIAYYTMYAEGGRSLRDMVERLRAFQPGRNDEFMHKILSLLNGDRSAIVMICSGLNDRNSHAQSLGPVGGLVSSSPEGYVDNLRALMSEIESIWQRCGGVEGRLHFAIMPSHALAPGDDLSLAAFRNAARTFAEPLPNVSMIDLARLVTHEEMRDNGYYDQDRPSDPHLSRAGYQALAKALSEELVKQ